MEITFNFVRKKSCNFFDPKISIIKPNCQKFR